MPQLDLDRAIAALGEEGCDDIHTRLDKQLIRTNLFGDEPLPQRVGRFVVLGELGRGGMGTVLRAYDDTLARQVAVKLMHDDGGSRRQARLLREAQALARISHPNVVGVYEVGEVDGQTFIAMELVGGRDLSHWQQRPHPWRACVDVYLQAGRGLAAAHAEGLVHRDFKPANCILDERGRVRVLDFGLARETSTATAEEDELSARIPIPSGPSGPETEVEGLVGTWAYMAPEQWLRRPADERSDQFSFCVALYEALYRERPFCRVPPLRLLQGIRGDAPLPALVTPAGPRVPRRLERALRRGLALHRQARWPSMAALLQQLERCRRHGLARRALLGGGVVALAMAGIGLRSPSPRAPSPCGDAREQLGRAWSDEQRERVEDAIASTGLAYADQTWATVERALDDYAAGWMREYMTACKATRVHREQSVEDLGLQERCLRRRRAALSHGVELLASADPGVVETAVVLVARLPDVEHCADLPALRAAAGPVRSPRDALEAERLRAHMELVRSLEITGQARRGLDEIVPVVAQAEVLGDQAVLAEALQIQGQLHVGVGEQRQGLRLLERAEAKALEYGAREVAIEALSSLIHLRGAEQAQTEVGLTLGSMAEALVRRHRPDGRLHAAVLTSIAQVHTVAGELKKARARYESAIEILQRVRGPADIALVEPLDGLAQVLRKDHELELAEHGYRRALSIRRATLGARHVATAHVMVNLGAVLEDEGRLSEAEQQVREALDILEETLLPDDERIAHARSNLGTVLSKQGLAAPAEVELRAALEIWGAALRSDHPTLAMAHINLGTVLGKQEQGAAAIEQYRAALDVLERGASTRKGEVLTAMALRNLGNALARRGREDEAEARYREAIDGLERGARGHPILASLLNRLGALRLRRGQSPELVEAMHTRALSIYEQTRGRETSIGHTLRARAEARVARAQWSLAREDLERARASYDRGGSPEYAAEMERRLAQLERPASP